MTQRQAAESNRIEKRGVLGAKLLGLMAKRLFFPSLMLFILALTLIGHMWTRSYGVQQMELANTIAYSTALFLENAERMIKSAAKHSEDASERELAFFLTATQDGFSYFDTLYVLSENGIVLQSAPWKPSLNGLDMSNNPLFQGIRSKEVFFVSRPFVSIRTGEPTVRMAVPIRNGRVMAGELNLEALRRNAFAAKHKPRVSEVMIIDQSGTFLAHPIPELVRQHARFRGISELKKTGFGTFNHICKHTGFWKLCSHSPVEKTNWLVLVQTPMSAIYRPLLQFAVPAVLFYAAGWLLVFLAFRKKFVDRIANPLTKLSTAASSIAAGNICAIADIEKDDEIGTVARAFNVMTEKLRLEIEIERLASHVSNVSMEMTEERADEEIGKILEKVGAFMGADRGYVCFFAEDPFVIRKTLMWRSKGPVQEDQSLFPEKLWKRVVSSIVRLDTFCLSENEIASSLDQYGNTGAATPRIQALVCVPMTYGKTLKGFLGFDSADKEKKWSFGELRLPFTVAKIVCNSLERIKTQAALRRAHDELEDRVRERTAELALAKDEAETANRARSVFLANMTHELRTPLNAIIGFTRLMANDPLIPPDQKDTLRIVKESAEDLLKMITKLLEMTKTESDKVILEPSDFDLLRLVREMDELIRVQAEYKGLEFSVKTHPDLPRSVKADKNKLREILLNLLGNAVKFTRIGEVSLKVTPLVDAFGSYPPGLKFCVSDTGLGISPEYKERIFEPFFQVSDDYESGEGTGLGLSICRKLVSLMGGEIAVESEPGKGSVFSFTIRIEPVDEKQPEKAPEKRRVVGIAPGQTPPAILVAEDDENNRILLVRLLQLAGFETRDAKNGLEAVEQCQNWRPRLVLMNTEMPVMDGYQAARIIKKGRFGVDRILAVTAGVLEDKMEKIRSSGFDGFIAKPFRENDIFDAIEKHFGIRYIHGYNRWTSGDAERTKAPGGLSKGSFAGLPARLLENLEKAVSIGSMDMISQVVAEIREENQALAGILEKLANEFKYDIVLTALHGAQ